MHSHFLTPLCFAAQGRSAPILLSASSMGQRSTGSSTTPPLCSFLLPKKSERAMWRNGMSSLHHTGGKGKRCSAHTLANDTVRLNHSQEKKPSDLFLEESFEFQDQ